MILSPSHTTFTRVARIIEKWLIPTCFHPFISLASSGFSHWPYSTTRPHGSGIPHRSCRATIASFYAQPIWERGERVVSFFDALGLGVFVCIGVQVSQENGLAWWASVGMGMVTATFGDLLRTRKWRLGKVWILAERAAFSRDCSQPSLARGLSPIESAKLRP